MNDQWRDELLKNPPRWAKKITEGEWAEIVSELISAPAYGGGSPFSGGHHTQETKNLISAANSGKGNPFFGKSHTQETLDRLSKSSAGPNNARYGTVWTSEQRLKLGRKGLGWWNDGVKNVRSYDKPGAEWSRGRFTLKNLGIKLLT